MHHSFDINLAAEYGIEEALLIHHFQHWISVNQRLKRNFHEGRTWSYQTIDEIAAHFPYISKDRVVTILEKLCTGKTRFQKDTEFEPILLKGNFNKTKFDRTIWYAFKNEEKFTKLWNHKMEVGEPQNQSCVTTTPIPDTKTDTKTNLFVADDPSGPPLGKIQVKVAEGKSKELVIEDVFRLAITKKVNWSKNEIEYAFGALAKYGGVVYDLTRFIEGTIEKYRNQIKSQKISKLKEKPCHQTNKSETCKKDSGEAATQARPFQPSPISLGEYLKRSQNGSKNPPDSLPS